MIGARGKKEWGEIERMKRKERVRKGVYVAYASMYARTRMYAYNCAGYVCVGGKKK